MNWPAWIGSSALLPLALGTLGRPIPVVCLGPQAQLLPQQEIEAPLALDLEAEFRVLLGSDWEATQAALERIGQAWQPNFCTPLVAFLRLSYYLRQPGFRSTSFALIDLLEAETGQAHGAKVSAWMRWIWTQDQAPHPRLADLLSFLYGHIDPKFAGYFSSERASLIDLDEVRWGGVLQDGIPPLRNPRMLSAAAAGYLEDEHLVFGIEVNGQARAYPKRILAWHEMFTDKLGGLELTGVY